MPRKTIIFIVSLSLLLLSASPGKLPPLQIADTWVWPLGDDGHTYTIRQNVKYGTTVENTDYSIRNLDLILGTDDITCFGVGGHRIYHAGVDLYRTDDSTAGSEVKAVANGAVIDITNGWPGFVILIEHTLPNSEKIYSLYAHLLDTVVNINDSVTVGENIGTVLQQTHFGRFGEFHPDGDDSHLHFEIRSFENGAAIFPDCSVTGKFGPSYGYPNLPDTYGYFDPLQFIVERLDLPNKVYLPLVLAASTAPNCQEGQDLLQNRGFEDGTIEDPVPWIEITTATDFDPLLYRLIKTNLVYAGQRSAGLGGWSTPLRTIDEELPQSFIIPSGTTSAILGTSYPSSE